MNSPLHSPSLSFWEIKQYLQDIELLVVGSGIVGLTTAIFFKQMHPAAKVLIVEKGMLPSGASTKNAGFACFGSPSEILSDLKNGTEEDVYDLIEQRYSGLLSLRELVGDRNMDFDTCGGYEVFRKEDAELHEKCLDFIATANKRLKNRLKLNLTYSSCDERIEGFGFAGVEHLLVNQHEGALDTGKMMHQLIKLAKQADITILNGMEVSEFVDSDSGVAVQFKNGIDIKCKKLHFATNGFTASLLPDLDVKPARAQVMITSPIANLKVNGTFHMDEGYYYFRNVGNRILLGGGRHLAMETETDTALKTTPIIQDMLDEILGSMILPKTTFTIEHRWAGIMGVGERKKAILKQVSENVSCAVRLGGMGVAIGTSIGKRSADVIG